MKQKQSFNSNFLRNPVQILAIAFLVSFFLVPMVFDRDGETMEMKSVEQWKLSDGGKILSIDSSSSTPRGERKATMVYDKN